MPPQGRPEPALRFLLLKRAADACCPPDAAIGAGHICHGSAGLRRGEQTRAGDEVGYLVTAPAVTLDADLCGVYPFETRQIAERRDHGVIGVLTGLTGLVENIRIESEIPVADKIRDIDGSPHRLRRHILVAGFGISFVEIKNDRVFFGAVEIFRFIKQAFARLTVEHFPVMELDGEPVVTGLLRIDMTEGARLVYIHSRSSCIDQPRRINIIGLVVASFQISERPTTLRLDSTSIAKGKGVA